VHIRQDFLPKSEPLASLEAILERDRELAHEQVFILPSPDPALRKFAVNRKLPAVVFGSLEEETDLPCVQFDEFELAYTATRLLLAKGHQRIFLLDRDTWVYGNSLRYEGFAKAMIEEQVIKERSEVDRYYIRVPTLHSHAIATVERLLKKNAGPMALLCNADRYAAWAIRAASGGQLRIPDDLMLISLQGSELAEQLTPRLTSLTESGYEVGMRIGHFVEKLLGAEKIASPRCVIQAGIVERETT
jgi:LacI family transcriptional regulator